MYGTDARLSGGYGLGGARASEPATTDEADQGETEETEMSELPFEKVCLYV